jgi:carbamoyl-phosphate synthase large subunit
MFRACCACFTFLYNAATSPDRLSAQGARPPPPGKHATMPRRTDISSILIIGAGPIIIGQASEFDYSGTQACKALRAEAIGSSGQLQSGHDHDGPGAADATYVEPITPRSSQDHREGAPDALLPTMGGQTALNCACRSTRWACSKSSASR